MKKLIILLSCLMFSNMIIAKEYDTNRTMKAMRGAFLMSIRATDLARLKPSLAELSSLVEEAKQGQFPEDKKAHYLEGLNKVSDVVQQAQQKANAGELKQAQKLLEQVDALRIQYHEQRKTSIWKRIFG